MPNYPEIVTKSDIERGISELESMRDTATLPHVRAILDSEIRLQVHVLNQWGIQTSALDKFVELVRGHTVKEYRLVLGYGDSDVVTWYVDEKDDDELAGIYDACYLHPNFDHLIETVDEESDDRDTGVTRYQLKLNTNAQKD